MPLSEQSCTECGGVVWQCPKCGQITCVNIDCKNSYSQPNLSGKIYCMSCNTSEQLRELCIEQKPISYDIFAANLKLEDDTIPDGRKICAAITALTVLKDNRDSVIKDPESLIVKISVDYWGVSSEEDTGSNRLVTHPPALGGMGRVGFVSLQASWYRDFLRPQELVNWRALSHKMLGVFVLRTRVTKGEITSFVFKNTIRGVAMVFEDVGLDYCIARCLLTRNICEFFGIERCELFGKIVSTK